MQSDPTQPEGKVNWYFLLYYSLLDNLWVKSSDPSLNDKRAGGAFYLAWALLAGGLNFLAGMGGMPLTPFVTIFLLLGWGIGIIYFHETTIREGRKKHNLRANRQYYRQHKRKIAFYKYLFFALCFGFFWLSFHLLANRPVVLTPSPY